MKHVNSVVGIVLMANFLTGCSSTQRHDPPATEESSPAGRESTSQEPSPTEEPSPTVAPATGPTVRVKGMRVNLPAGWQQGMHSALQAGGYSSDPGTMIELFRFPQLTFKSIDELARVDSRSGMWGPRPQREEDVTVGDVTVTHLTGRSSRGYQLEHFATLFDQQQLEVNFFFANKESKSVREEIIQSVLATWEFTT